MDEPIEVWEEVLKTKRDYILKSVGEDNVLLNHILDYLQSKMTIYPDHVEVIRAGITSKDRFVKMLDFVSAGGKPAMYELCSAFRDFNMSNAINMADFLEQALDKEIVNGVYESRVSSEVEKLRAERDQLVMERDQLRAERDALKTESDQLKTEIVQLKTEIYRVGRRFQGITSLDDEGTG